MAPSGLSQTQPTKGLDRVRRELLTALQFGQLTPGDQVPSVRRLADQTGMNRKTVHRAYRRLAREGLLDLRPGSGTFVAELLAAANRCRATAKGLGIRPEALAAFLQVHLGNGLRDVPLVVTECNREQLGLIEQELRLVLGVRTRPVLLAELAERPERTLRGQAGVVTTDCHRTEVTGMVEGRAVPVYRLALDPRFPRQLIEQARQRPVLLVVRDRHFAPVFLRLLRQLGAPREVLDRFCIVEPSGVAGAVGRIGGPATVCVSPLIQLPAAMRLPRRFGRLRSRWRIEPRSLERLGAAVALDVSGELTPARRGDA